MAAKLFQRDTKTDDRNWTGFFDQSVKLEGTLEVTGTFRINGQLKGKIISHQSLILGESAGVEGEIQGNHVIVTGRFDGVIVAKGRVEIHPKGVVRGEIHTPCLVIEPGGIFDGRCHMLTSADATASLTIPIRAATRTY